MGNLSQISHYGESLGLRKGKCSQKFGRSIAFPPAGGKPLRFQSLSRARWQQILSYRPIALTSCFCKTFERMVNTRLVYVLEKEKCIPPLQSGFRKSRSTLDLFF
ncbi:hypothetical protein TNCV_3573291 [Trichonephila clavipes]|nr:hypothetical protein TNCV_3573291 [Trichonephila clavipes]